PLRLAEPDQKEVERRRVESSARVAVAIVSHGARATKRARSVLGRAQELMDLRLQVSQLVLCLTSRTELVRPQQLADAHGGLGAQLQQLPPELADRLQLRLDISRLDLSRRQELVGEACVRLTELVDDRPSGGAVRREDRPRLTLLIRRQVQRVERHS